MMMGLPGNMLRDNTDMGKSVSSREEIVLLQEKLKWSEWELKAQKKFADKIFNFFNNKYPDDMNVCLDSCDGEYGEPA